jgi:hypothetical protein
MSKAWIRVKPRKKQIPPHMGPKKKEGIKVFLGFRIISRKEKLLSKYVPVTIASVAGKTNYNLCSFGSFFPPM